MNKIIIVLSFVLSFAGHSFAATTSQEIRNEVFPVINEGLEELAQNKDVSKRSVTEILTFRDSKFERLIAECFEIMANSSFVELLDDQEKMQREIQKKQDKKIELAKASFTAPDKSWNPLKTTQESIKSDSAKLNAEIEELRLEFEKKKEAVFLQMQAAGAPISRQQFDMMIGAVDTADQAKIMAIAENLKFITEEIEQKLADPNAPIELIKMYTGVYMMSYKIYLYAIEQAVLSIDEKYLPKLFVMKEENDRLHANSLKLRSDEQVETDRKLLESNLGHQERMVTVINTYESYLVNQRKRLMSLGKSIQKRFKVAENTFYTIKLSSELLGLIRNSEADFSQIFSFKPAELSVMYDERLRNEFMEVSKNLKMND